VAFPRLVKAFFKTRPNRFLVLAEVRGKLVRVASADPGRLRELLLPGRELRLIPATTPGRKTSYTLALVRHAGVWVSLIPALANQIFEGALARQGVPGIRGRVLEREVSREGSRFDFLVGVNGRRVLTEVKSATLVVSGRAYFPDAPTARGARHVRELTRHVRLGGHSLLVFLVQRSDAHDLTPHAANDPILAAALKEAQRAGVTIRAYRCDVGPTGCTLLGRIPYKSPE